LKRHILREIPSTPNADQLTRTVPPEPFDSPFVLRFSKDEWRLRTGSVEGCWIQPFMLRQAQHEREDLPCPYNYGPIDNSGLVNHYALAKSSVIGFVAPEEI